MVLSYGTSLLEVLATDTTTGHEVRRMLALAVLDELTILDRPAATITGNALRIEEQNSHYNLCIWRPNFTSTVYSPC